MLTEMHPMVLLESQPADGTEGLDRPAVHVPISFTPPRKCTPPWVPTWKPNHREPIRVVGADRAVQKGGD